MMLESGVNPGDEDPDDIAANPPEPVDEPSKIFQIGKHQGQWLEYDERGVPTKNIKKKKPTKKEKDFLEQEYLDAKKKHGQYCNDVKEWKQRQLQAEAALERKDRFRWCFRQIGVDKNSPIDESELEELLTLLGYASISPAELTSVKKEVSKIVNSDGQLEQTPLRTFVKETFPMLLLEERLRTNEHCNTFEPTALYSPRTWRKKMEKNSLEKSSRPSGDSAKSKSPRKGSSSPRGKKEKGGGSSPRGASSPREKKEKKEKSGGADSPRSKKKESSKKEKK